MDYECLCMLCQSVIATKAAPPVRSQFHRTMGKLPQFSPLVFWSCYLPACYHLCFRLWRSEAGSFPDSTQTRRKKDGLNTYTGAHAHAVLSVITKLFLTTKGWGFWTLLHRNWCALRASKIPKFCTGSIDSPKFYVNIMKKHWIRT